VEIPVMVGIILKQYDLEALDPLPGMNWSQSFGVVSPDTRKGWRAKYKRRQ